MSLRKIEQTPDHVSIEVLYKPLHFVVLRLGECSRILFKAFR